jgi:hypothetical protein
MVGPLGDFVGEVQTELGRRGEPPDLDPIEAALLRNGCRNRDAAAEVVHKVLRLRRARAGLLAARRLVGK